MVDADFSASHPLFLRSGNGVPISLYQTNVTLCPDKKGPGHQAPRSPSGVPVPTKEKAELSGRPAQDQGLRPCQPPPLKAPGAQHPASPQAAQLAGTRSRSLRLMLFSQSRGWWRASLPPQDLGLARGWPWGGPWSLFPGPSSSPAVLSLGELEGLLEKARIRLLPHSLPDEHQSTNHWLNHRLTLMTLTTGSLEAGPTAALSNG